MSTVVPITSCPRGENPVPRQLLTSHQVEKTPPCEGALGKVVGSWTAHGAAASGLAADSSYIFAQQRLLRIELSGVRVGKGQKSRRIFGTGAIAPNHILSEMREPEKGLPNARRFQLISGWMLHYQRFTRGVLGADNASTLLDDEAEPQPDASLFIRPERGGRTRLEDGFIAGARS